MDDTALVRQSRPLRGSPRARRSGRAATVGAVVLALAVVAGVLSVRFPGLFERSPAGVAETSAGNAPPSGWLLHLFPTAAGSSDRSYRSYAAIRRERLTQASAPPVAPVPAPAPAVEAAPAPSAPPIAAAAPPTPSQPVPAPAVTPAPPPSIEQAPAAATAALPAMPRLKLAEKPAPLGSIVLVSGVPTTAPTAFPAAPEVKVAEVEAPVTLPPKPAGAKPAPPRRADAGGKHARGVEVEAMPATPLIPPADLTGGPPPMREPLSLDTGLAPLAPHGSGVPGATGASGSSTIGVPAGAPARAPSGSAAPSKEASLLAAHAATPPVPAEPRKIEPMTARIVFDTNATDLPPGAERELDAIVAAASGDPHRRVQLTSYASGDADGGNLARRVSLSRALAVRAYLIQQGIASGRLEVRALGNRNESGPADRVDLRVGDS
jgi:outer membrane protein OmpA-like peptidoglycan-associated protein